MHTVANLFGIPAVGAIVGAVFAGPVGLAAGMLLGWGLGIVIDGRESPKDRRIAELERQVRDLEEELDNESGAK